MTGMFDQLLSPHRHFLQMLAHEPIDTFAQRLCADPGLPRTNPTISWWQQNPPIDHVNHKSDGTGLLSSNHSLSVTVLEARTLCSGATGSHGGHIKCVPVTDYPRLRRELGHDAAAEIIRFVMMHYESICGVVGELSIQKISEARPVTTVTVVLKPDKAEELRDGHALFEESFLEYKGVYQFH